MEKTKNIFKEMLQIIYLLSSESEVLASIEKHAEFLCYKFPQYNKRTMRRRVENIINCQEELKTLGFWIKEKNINNKIKYNFSFDSKRKINNALELDAILSNALIDSLDIAAVSSSFHYKKDIPNLKYWLRNNIIFEEEDYEIYVGHNNRKEDSQYFNTIKKLSVIKEAIKKHKMLEFSIRFDEENHELKSIDKLEKKLLVSKDPDGAFKKHKMFPVFIIHDSDESFIFFKKWDAMKLVVSNHYVNIDNIIYKPDIKCKIINDAKNYYANLKINKADCVGKYSFNCREKVSIKIDVNINYKFLTRHSQYCISRDWQKTDSLILDFSEIYHALNFIFMNGGIKKVLGKFEQDKENEQIKKYWKEKMTIIRNDK